MRARQAYKQVREIHVAQKRSDRGHQDILHEGGDDLPEGGADDDADGHVQDISTHCEFLEFFQHLRLLSISLVERELIRPKGQYSRGEASQNQNRSGRCQGNPHPAELYYNQA